MESVSLLYVTCEDSDEARRIGRALVAERLVACANVLAPHTAIYRWQGEVQEDAEVAMIVKTRTALVDEVSSRIKALHSYDVPCVVALPVAAGNAAFLRWIADETG